LKTAELQRFLGFESFAVQETRPTSSGIPTAFERLFVPQGHRWIEPLVRNIVSA
jgi:hypothetical protein